MRKNKAKTIYTEKVLEALDRPTLSERELEHARKTNWTIISQRINLINSNIMKRPIFLNNKRIQLMFGVVSIVIVLSVFFTYALLLSNKSNIKNNTNVSQTSTVFQSDNFDFLSYSSNRVKYLNNGYSKEDLKLLGLSKAELDALGPETIEKAIKIRKDLQEGRVFKVFFSKVQSQTNNDVLKQIPAGTFRYKDDPTYIFPVENSQPLTTQCWFHPKFYKKVVFDSQNKVIDFSLIEESTNNILHSIDYTSKNNRNNVAVESIYNDDENDNYGEDYGYSYCDQEESMLDTYSRFLTNQSSYYNLTSYISDQTTRIVEISEYRDFLTNKQIEVKNIGNQKYNTLKIKFSIDINKQIINKIERSWNDDILQIINFIDRKEYLLSDIQKSDNLIEIKGIKIVDQDKDIFSEFPNGESGGIRFEEDIPTDEKSLLNGISNLKNIKTSEINNTKVTKNNNFNCFLLTRASVPNLNSLCLITIFGGREYSFNVTIPNDNIDESYIYDYSTEIYPVQGSSSESYLTVRFVILPLSYEDFIKQTSDLKLDYYKVYAFKGKTIVMLTNDLYLKDKSILQKIIDLAK